jgi:anoctamin-8
MWNKQVLLRRLRTIFKAILFLSTWQALLHRLKLLLHAKPRVQPCSSGQFDYVLLWKCKSIAVTTDTKPVLSDDTLSYWSYLRIVYICKLVWYWYQRRVYKRRKRIIAPAIDVHQVRHTVLDALRQQGLHVTTRSSVLWDDHPDETMDVASNSVSGSSVSDTEQLHHDDVDQKQGHDESGYIMDLISAPYDVLERVAKQLQIVECDDGSVSTGTSSRLSDGQGGICFVADNGSLRKHAGTRAFFSSSERQRVVRSLLLSIKSHLNGRALLPVLLDENMFLEAMYPLHDSAVKSALLRKWVRSTGSEALLDQFAAYFGTETSFYFAWVDYYTMWLVAPAIFGVAMYSWKLVLEAAGESNLLDQVKQTEAYQTFVAHHASEVLSPVALTYAFVMLLWGVLFIVFWQRRQARLAYRWGVWSFESQQLMEEPQPSFRGDIGRNPVTGKREVVYPSWKRWCIYMITMPFTLFMIVLAYALVLLTVAAEDYIVGHPIGPPALRGLLPYVPTVLHSIAIPAMNFVYCSLSLRTTRLENHRTAFTHRKVLCWKLVAFYFANSYFSLFYIAFAKRDVQDLREKLIAIMIVRQLISHVQEIAIPRIVGTVRVRAAVAGSAMSSNSNNDEKQGQEQEEDYLVTGHSHEDDPTNSHKEAVTIEPYELESKMDEYPGIFAEYLEMVFQFGYIVLFGWVWPLAPLLAWINNIIEVRSDAFSLIKDFRRPPRCTSKGIDTWLSVLRGIVVLAVCNIFALLGQALLVQNLDSYFVPACISKLSDNAQVLLLVIGEHVVLVMVALLFSVSPVDDALALQLAQDEYARTKDHDHDHDHDHHSTAGEEPQSDSDISDIDQLIDTDSDADTDMQHSHASSVHYDASVMALLSPRSKSALRKRTVHPI